MQPNLKQAAAVYRTAMLTNPFFEDVPLLVDDVRVARNGKDYTLLDNAGNAVRVAMPRKPSSTSSPLPAAIRSPRWSL